MGNNETCAKYGCCNYDRCVANYTVGVDFDMPSSSYVPSPSTEPSMVNSPTPLLEPSSAVVPMASEPENPATSSVKAKISPEMAIASSAPEAKITSEIPAASPFMTKITSVPMTSVQPEMQSTEGKEVLMPTSEQEMKPSLTISGGVFKSQVLEPVEEETCPNGSRRLLNVGTLLVVAVGLLCSIF